MGTKIRGSVPGSDSSEGVPLEDEKYTPKVYSSKEMMAFAAKLAAIVGAVVVLLWLLNRNL